MNMYFFRKQIVYSQKKQKINKVKQFEIKSQKQQQSSFSETIQKLILNSSNIDLKEMSHERINIELSSQEFSQRFKVITQMHDPFARHYFIATDTVTQKRTIYKHYLAQTEEQLQAIYDNIENYIKLSQQQGICKILAYTRLVEQQQILATFEYNDLSLGEYILTPQFIQNRPIFYIKLLQQITSIIRSMSEIGIDIDQLNYGNILVANYGSFQDLSIMVFYDQREKTFDKVLQGLKTFTSLEKLTALLTGNEEYFNQLAQLEDGISPQNIYLLGLILVDLMYKCENSSNMILQDDFLARDRPVSRSTQTINEDKGYFLIEDGLISINQQLINKKLQNLRNNPSQVIKQLTQLAESMMAKMQERIKIYQLPGEIDRLIKIYRDSSKKTVRSVSQQIGQNNDKNQQQQQDFSSRQVNGQNQQNKEENSNSSQDQKNTQQIQESNTTSFIAQSHTQTNKKFFQQRQTYATVTNTIQSLSEKGIVTTNVINENFNRFSNMTIHYPQSENQKKNPNNSQNNLDISNEKPPRLIIPKQSILMNLKVHESIKSSLQNLIKQIQNIPDLRKKQYYDNSVYYGGVSSLSNKRTGLGIYLYPSGDIYFGTWLENQLVDGTYIFKNGQTYEGSVKNGKQGWGRYRYSNGNVYEGEWRDDIKQGKGTMWYPNQDKYQGHWVKGKKNGWGKYFYNNGTIYEGNFSNGRKQGFGTIIFQNGTKIEANWHQTHVEGQGKVTYPNGDFFQGEYYMSQKHGKGMYIWGSDNTKYEGQFKKDSLQGEARIFFTQNQYYSGRIRNGKRDGQGKYVYENGDSFTGQWKNDMKLIGNYKFKNGDQFEGKFKENQLSFGVLKYNNGETFEGQFRNGCRHGIGSYRNCYGQLICEGHWQNNNFIQHSQQ